jgi:capsule polysaccharide export protein KpsE/RkpR
MLTIECLNKELLRIEDEIKKLEEINNENNKKIEDLKNEYEKIDKELNEKYSSAAASKSVDIFMERCIIDKPLITSLLFAVDDSGESELIKKTKSKWNR